MENFLIDESFYSELGDLIDELLEDNEDIESLPDGWTQKAESTDLEPVMTLDVDWLCERVDEERLDEDGDIMGKVEKAFKLIDFEKVNSAMPRMYYPSGKFFTITKQDLLDWIK